MSKEEKSPETKVVAAAVKIDIEQERLELDKKRLRLDVESRETAQRLEIARLKLDKAKERTTKLQIFLPILISVFAIGLSVWTALLQYKLQYGSSVSSYNQARLELFRKLTEHTADSTEVKKIFAEIFPNDARVLEGEQKTQQKNER